MGLRQKQWVFLVNVAKLILWAEQQGMELTGGELFRPEVLQSIYLKTGKSKKQRSLHQDRLAIDLNLFVDTNNDGVKDYVADSSKYKPLGDYWCSLHPNNRWGGDWNRNGNYKDEKFLDGNHFEML